MVDQTNDPHTVECHDWWSEEIDPDVVTHMKDVMGFVSSKPTQLW